MKRGGLVADVTPARPSGRAEHDILGVTLTLFWAVQAAIVAEKLLCDMGIPSSALIGLLRVTL